MTLRKLEFLRSRRTWDAESRELRERKSRSSATTRPAPSKRFSPPRPSLAKKEQEKISPDHLPA